MKIKHRKHNIFDVHRFLNGFTLIELLLVFAMIGVITALGAFSFGSYNTNQQFGTSISEFTNFVSTTRSKAISQVKPPVCSSGQLNGYKVKVTISGTDYEQDVVCGGVSYPISKRKLSSQLSFENGSADSFFFDVSTGTVPNPSAIAITGFGKTNTVSIDKIGNISLNAGFTVTSVPTAVPTLPVAPTTAPPAQSSTTGYTFYSDGTTAKSGTPGSSVVAFAYGAASGVGYQLVAGNNGGNSSLPCSQNVVVLNPSTVYTGTGYIGNTTGTISMTSGEWQICFRDVAGQTATSPLTFSVIGGPSPTNSSTIPTPTTAPVNPTPTTGPSCSKDYYYISPTECRLVGYNAGQYCDATCGGQVGATAPTPTPTPAVNSSPIVTNAVISPTTVTPDGSSQYTITVTGTDNDGGNDIGVAYSIINYQGVNGSSANYRGYLGWSAIGSFPYWSTYKAGTPINCSGSGQGAIRLDGSWGDQYINLISCSAPVVVGNTRTVNFVVSFDPSFTSPTTNNTLTGYVRDWSGLEDTPVWKPFGTFNLSVAPTPVPTASQATASVNVAFSVSPNPVSSSGYITLSATVTGTSCTPSGVVNFYRDNQATRFVAAGTSSGNPSIATYSNYPASVIGVGTHPLYAQYVTSSTCPSGNSPSVNLVIN